MIAGGVGAVAAEHVAAAAVPVGAKLVILGGPAMLIGLGGGAASSMAAGEGDAELDFASVQRDNAEMQRRCQEVIDRCCALGAANPIRLIHDVGAGGLSNALPELLRDAGVGGRFDIRAVPTADAGMSPMEIWCNEAQERYALAIAAPDLPAFAAICKRERCPHAVVGETTAERRLLVVDSRLGGAPPVDMPLAALFGDVPNTVREFATRRRATRAFNYARLDLAEAIERVLRFPAVASKKFLVTIGDRSITGLVARDQMVGRRQVPVADVAVTLGGLPNLPRRGDGDGRTGPAGRAESRGGGAHGGGGSAHQSGCRPHRHAPHRAVRELDGGGWPRGGGSSAARSRGGRFRTVPGAGHRHSGGQGQPLHAHGVGRRSAGRDPTRGGVAGDPQRDRVRAGGRTCAPRSRPTLGATTRWPSTTPAARNAERGASTHGLWLVEPPFARQRRLGGSALLQCHGGLGETVPDVDDAAALQR